MTTFGVWAQLVPTNTAPYNSATWLVQNILVGQGVSVSNINYTGSANAIGFFTAQSTNLGLDSGIVMTSGSIFNTPGPNTVGSSGTNNLASGDSLLDDYSGQTTYDAAILEFDFVAVSDTLQFNYVFGSEEYPEYVGPPCGTSNFNDVFGFFLTGPKPGGGTYSSQNLATVGTSPLIVSINNLNCQCFSSYYVCNDPNNANQAPTNQCASVYGCPTTSVGTTVQYDGFTLVMQVYSPVVCGQSYHIKMAIADAGDGIYDSGIFIEAKSFKGPSLRMVTQTDSTGNSLDTALIEGCTTTGLEFLRTGNWDDTIMVPLFYAGTADNGIDYVQLPDTIYIMPDSSSYTLDIQSVFDGNIEGTETILIYSDSVFTDCSTFPPDTLSFTITDQPPFQVTGLYDTLLGCPGDVVNYNLAISGGIGAYTYAWGDGSTALSRTFNPTTDLVLSFFATDSCGNQVYDDTVTISVPPDVPISFDLRDTLLCEGEVLSLIPGLSGGYQPLQFTWQDGSSDSIFTEIPSSSGWYWLQVDDFCGFSETDSMFLDLSPDPDPNYNYLAYPDQNVQFTNTSINATIYAWDFGDGSGLNFDTNPMHLYDAGGTYMVWLYAENDDGCRDSISQLVDVIPIFHLYIPNSFSPNGDNMNECFQVVGEGFSTYSIEIYDRWGKQMYYSENINECWDGDFEGTAAEAGTYTYRIKLILPLESEPYTEQGYLFLMR
jgi:gliding motility-associated-like protein